MKSKATFFLPIVLLASACVLFFQNCSEGFKVLSNQNENVSPAAEEFVAVSSSGESAALNIVVKESSSALLLSEKNVTGSFAKDAILQRDASGKARLQLKFVLPAGVMSFRTKLMGASGTQLSSVSPLSENSVEVLVSTGMSSATLMLQFFDGAGLEKARWSSPSFTVGDVLLVAGQSNAATHGETPSASRNTLNRTWSYETKMWQPLADPLPLASHWKMQAFGGQAGTGGSAWPLFADILSNRTGVPVGVVSVAWGGSSIAQWLNGGSDTYKQQYQKDEPLVNRLVAAAQGLAGCQFKAVLWHQGESDSVYATSRNDYRDSMLRLREAFVQRTGCQQPWVIARASFVPTSFNVPVSRMMDIRDAQTEISKRSGFASGPDTDLLASPAYRFDKLHFSSQGMNIHALLWAEKVLALNGVASGFSEEKNIPDVHSIMNFYRDILKRSDPDIVADYNGLFYHARLLQEGSLTLSQVQQSFEASDEAFIQQKFLYYYAKKAAMSDVLYLLSKMSSGEVKDRTALEIYIRGYYNRTMTATIVGRPLECGNLGDASKNTIATWYLADLGRCPDVDGVIYWYSEWKKQGLSLVQWKVASWDANPIVQTFKKCLGSNPSDEVVTSCYRSTVVDGKSYELCGPGAPWLHRKGTNQCYLK